MSDIHTILQLLQRQPTLGPPAYSTVTASPDYHRPAVKVQPVALSSSHFFSHTGTQVRQFSDIVIVAIFVRMWHEAFYGLPRWSPEVMHQLPFTITNLILTKSSVMLKETNR